jgi:transposase, IS30 family
MGAGRYRHLSFEEREQIAICRLEGVSQAEMARRLGRSSSTVNRELARNRLPAGGYQPSFADRVDSLAKRRGGYIKQIGSECLCQGL